MQILIGELCGQGSICPQSHREECLWPEASTRAPQKLSTQISLLHFFNTGYQLINKTININLFSLIKCIYNHSLLYGKHLPENVHLKHAFTLKYATKIHISNIRYSSTYRNSSFPFASPINHCHFFKSFNKFISTNCCLKAGTIDTKIWCAARVISLCCLSG